jgi:predicted nucleotidyltransferase
LSLTVDILEDELGVDDQAFVDGRILGASPWLFRGSSVTFSDWRLAVAADLGASSDDVFLVGSASTGFSLNPDSPGRPFRLLTGTAATASDIDVAVVSTAIFSDAWDVLVRLDRLRALGLAYDARSAIRSGVYWGHIAQHRIPLGTSPARTLSQTAGAVARRSPTLGYRVSVRVYRRLEDLRGYQIDSLRLVRSALGLT